VTSAPQHRPCQDLHRSVRAFVQVKLDHAIIGKFLPFLIAARLLRVGHALSRSTGAQLSFCFALWQHQASATPSATHPVRADPLALRQSVRRPACRRHS